MSYQGEDLHRRASDVFLQVCELELPDRVQRMEAACGDDAVLLREVRSLLDAHERLTGFLAKPARVDPLLAQPQRIGRYKVLEVLGRGGMGVVYLAEQDHPRRQVALKVLQPGLVGPQRARRFEHEAEILGRLHHPGIAQIFEAGREQGSDGAQPWFAMELVRGKSLIEYAEHHRLALRERLQLFTRICAAVQHAHQHGVVHRDLKPANILVDEAGQPKVLDFGIARAAEVDSPASSVLTARGELLGTLPYMSPEQLGGDPDRVDARTDVYALGVIAYQLVSGRLPHDSTGKHMVDVVRAIRETDPPPLGSQRRELAGDVETIVAKALEKDPDRRYASAAELAADVERFLGHEPVLARPASTAYQLAKFARRNRMLVGGAAATFVALLFGIAGTSWQAVRASEQAGLAKSNEAAAKLKEAEAVASERRAQKVTRLMKRAMVESDPNWAGKRDLTVVEAMDNAIRDLDAGALKDEPETEAYLQDTIAGILWGNSRLEEALRLSSAALATWQRVSPGDHVDVAHGLKSVALTLLDLGRAAEALPKFESALEISQRLFPGDHELVADLLDGTGRCLVSLGRSEEALPKHAAALEMWKRLFPGDRAEVASSLCDHGNCLKALGRDAEALQDFEAALAMDQRLYPGDQLRIARSLNVVAVCLESVGRPEEALAKFEAALEMSQRLIPGDHALVAEYLYNVAGTLKSLGRAAEALPMYEEALEMTQRLSPDGHPRVARMLTGVGYCLQSLGRADEALPKYEAALELNRRFFPGDHPDLAMNLIGLGFCLRGLGRIEDALPNLESALAMEQRLHPGDHPDVATAMFNVAKCLQSLGRSAEALPNFEAVLQMFRRLNPGDHPRVVLGLHELAACLASLGRHADALPNLEEALQIQQRRFPGDHPEVAGSLLDVARCLSSLGRDAEALPKYEAAVEMEQRLHPGDHPDVAWSLRVLAACLHSLGRSAEALPYAQEASEIGERLFPEGHRARLELAETLSSIRAATTSPASAAASKQED